MANNKGCCGPTGGVTEINTPPSGVPLQQHPTEYVHVVPPPEPPCPTPITTPACPCPSFPPQPTYPPCTGYLGCGCPRCLPKPYCPPPYTSPVPHYLIPQLSPEGCKPIVSNVLVGAFKNTCSFAMPACKAKLKVTFDLVGDLPLGSWLWSYGIGYLTVVGYNSTTREAELLNECLTFDCGGQVQAPPGTPIPAGTNFVLQAPLCSTATNATSSIYPYLNSGFVAPAVHGCIDIATTNTNGLSVNALVSIANGEFRIGAIYSGTRISICNDGAGVAPGTVVEYKSGETLLHPITLIQSNVCLNTGSPSGKILVCKNNTQTPLTGTNPGQVPVYDHVTGEVQFKTIDVGTLDCTALKTDLVIAPQELGEDEGEGGPYPAYVEDSSAFAVDDLVNINSIRFKIKEIPEAGVFLLDPIDRVTAITTWARGASVCQLSCCDELHVDIKELEINMNAANAAQDAKIQLFKSSLWAEANVNTIETSGVLSELSVPPNLSVATTRLDLIITNGSPSLSMGVLIYVDAEFDYQFEDTDAAHVADISRYVWFGGQYGTVPVTSMEKLYENYTTHKMIIAPAGILPFDNVNRDSHNASGLRYITMDPTPGHDQHKYTISAQAQIVYNRGSIGVIRVNRINLKMAYFGVAVREYGSAIR